MNTRNELGLHAKTLGAVIIAVTRPMPAAPRSSLIVAARCLPAAVVCYRYLIVVPRPLPTAPFLVRRRYFIVVPRPLPAALLLCVAHI
jgi:hypothetical protein